jgi:restriction system protein
VSKRGQMRVMHTSRGAQRFQLEIYHDALQKREVVSGTSQHVVESKARTKMAQWDTTWEREEKKRLAIERTQEAQEALESLERVLLEVVDMDTAIDWESLKDHSGYLQPKPKPPELPKPGFLTKVMSSQKAKHDKRVAELEAEYQAALAAWEGRKAEHLKARDEKNAAIEQHKLRYLAREPQAILHYNDLVLSNSSYPDCFPQAYELDYQPDSLVLIVDYQLPSLESLPTLREVTYVQSRDEFSEKHIPQSQFNRLYDNLLYQVALRTLYELFKADRINALAAVVFNGFVHTIDPATGQEITPCVLSLQAGKSEFEQINLANVEPKACFRKLKGISSSKLYSLTPIAPILRIDRQDSRFVDAYSVADTLDEEENLAAMDWEDFEHLIRELFEREFASTGSEVRVTRASRDGGIDAVIFDPDPLRGGKIVVQAKRYTNTVGVSAIRDLYGTVMNEGANKGILVTTADYGPDAYGFAKGKPLVLLNGNNLLHLLENHGYKAKIDLREAKKILAERG